MGRSQYEYSSAIKPCCQTPLTGDALQADDDRERVGGRQCQLVHREPGEVQRCFGLGRVVAVQVAACESEGLKPGIHSISSRVETRRFQAMALQATGQLRSTCTAPRLVRLAQALRVLRALGRGAAGARLHQAAPLLQVAAQCKQAITSVVTLHS